MTTTKAPTIHTFNTGRVYTNNGQRIAWCVLSTGNVAMWDVDRMIDYVLIVQGEPTNRSVLAAYDDHTARPTYNEAERNEARDLRDELVRAAQALPAAPVYPKW